MNQLGEVIGVVIGSYSDCPLKTRRPNLYTIIDELNPFKARIILPGEKEAVASKNFNFALSFEHPEVQRMLLHMQTRYVPPFPVLLTEANIPHQIFRIGGQDCALFTFGNLAPPLWNLIRLQKVEYIYLMMIFLVVDRKGILFGVV